MKLSALGIINALGSSKNQVFKNACLGSQHGLKRTEDIVPEKKIYCGLVLEELPTIRDPIYDFRTNQLLLHAFTQIESEWIKLTEKYFASRIGIVLGTNNAGLEKFYLYTKPYFQYGLLSNDLKIKWLEEGAIAEFLQDITKAKGPFYVVSTACSSSAKVFSTARNLINSDVCDAVLVGGADDLCVMTVRGFDALGAYSSGISNPSSENRDGINIGEGAALFIMEKDCDEIQILGIGESSDAYHITSPDPAGTGVKKSMVSALEDALLIAEDISYINLHGTGTFQNDLMENKAVAEIFGNKVICASTKALTGHLLGAAGVTEIALCWLMMSEEFNKNHVVIPHIYDGNDIENPLNFARLNHYKKVKCCLSNSFAFGGNNASVIVGKRDV